MNRHELTDFGPVTHFDAAHLVLEDGRVVGYVPEPAERSEWTGEREEAFREAIRAEAREYEESLFIQFDPNRDQVTDEWIDN